MNKVLFERNVDSAYVIGVALGDGNLSRPNGRATRLRITCDSRYPEIAKEMSTALQRLFPTNKVSIYPRQATTHFDISVYTNKLDELLPWKVGHGSKHAQNAHVPEWIFSHHHTALACLRGLLQTDGSIYNDRGYLMVNFASNIPSLAHDVMRLMQQLGYEPRLTQTAQPSGRTKYTVRLARNVARFVKEINFKKC